MVPSNNTTKTTPNQILQNEKTTNKTNEAHPAQTEPTQTQPNSNQTTTKPNPSPKTPTSGRAGGVGAVDVLCLSTEIIGEDTTIVRQRHTNQAEQNQTEHNKKYHCESSDKTRGADGQVGRGMIGVHLSPEVIGAITTSNQTTQTNHQPNQTNQSKANENQLKPKPILPQFKPNQTKSNENQTKPNQNHNQNQFKTNSDQTEQNPIKNQSKPNQPSQSQSESKPNRTKKKQATPHQTEPKPLHGINSRYCWLGEVGTRPSLGRDCTIAGGGGPVSGGAASWGGQAHSSNGRCRLQRATIIGG